MALDSSNPTIEFSFCQFFLFLVSLVACAFSFFYLKLQQGLYEAQRTCDLPLDASLEKLLADHLLCKGGAEE